MLYLYLHYYAITITVIISLMTGLPTAYKVVLEVMMTELSQAGRRIVLADLVGQQSDNNTDHASHSTAQCFDNKLVLVSIVTHRYYDRLQWRFVRNFHSDTLNQPLSFTNLIHFELTFLLWIIIRYFDKVGRGQGLML